MNFRRHLLCLTFLGLTLGPAAGSLGAATRVRPPPESDLASKEVRQQTVDLATTLAKVEMPTSVTEAPLPQPFNPPGFGRASSHEPRPNAEAPSPSKAFGDREILAALAPRIVPKGTLSLGSNSLLIFGKKNLRVGDRLTVSFEGTDYTLELVAFDRTNFTLRLNHEEITRPIKPGKNP
jgi:hypothetical protein